MDSSRQTKPRPDLTARVLSRKWRFPVLIQRSCTERSGNFFRFDPASYAIDEVLDLCLCDAVSAEVADEGIVTQIFFECLVELLLEGDVSFEETLEGLLAERQWFGLVTVEVCAKFLEDWLHH